MAGTTLPAEPDMVAAAFDRLAEVLASKDFSPPQLRQGELVTVDSTKPTELERRIYCRDCLDVRYSQVGEPPQGGSSWGAHMSLVSGHKVTIEHPRKPKILTYDRSAVLAGIESGSHGRQCLQCGTVLLQEVS